MQKITIRDGSFEGFDNEYNVYNYKIIAICLKSIYI